MPSPCAASGQISEAAGRRPAAFVVSGGTLLVFMGDPVRKDNYNDVLLPRKLLPGPLIKRVDSGPDGAGFIFDFKPTDVHHPFLRLFKNEENTGLDTAKAFTYWQVDVPPDSKVERVLNYVPAPDRNGKPAPPRAGRPTPPSPSTRWARAGSSSSPPPPTPARTPTSGPTSRPRWPTSS